MKIELDLRKSSLLEYAVFDNETEEITVHFKEKTGFTPTVYIGFKQEYFNEFLVTPSFGKFYLHYIKPNFSQKNTKDMAHDKTIKLKINVKDINKEWLHVGEKGVYLNCTLLYKEEQDQYGNNGMIIQDVPTELYKKAKEKNEELRGEILGNAKEFAKQGGGSQASAGTNTKPTDDDLPF